MSQSMEATNFESLRIFMLLLHFVCTVPLYWTQVDSVQVTTESVNTREEYGYNYTILISFSLFCMLIEAVVLSFYLHTINLLYCIHVMLDCIGIFFALWISLDGLAWQTYIVISTVCVILPACVDIVISLLSVTRGVKVRFKQPRYIQGNRCWPY
mmetsp:Transcript_25089/g.36990  ORF Transcript_25089/g.36990 Transcript_25089/m.36990 type:complete len:155 (-) Transcript_25089:53-517(-)